MFYLESKITGISSKGNHYIYHLGRRDIRYGSFTLKELLEIKNLITRAESHYKEKDAEYVCDSSDV